MHLITRSIQRARIRSCCMDDDDYDVSALMLQVGNPVESPHLHLHQICPRTSYPIDKYSDHTHTYAHRSVMCGWRRVFTAQRAISRKLVRHCHGDGEDAGLPEKPSLLARESQKTSMNDHSVEVTADPSGSEIDLHLFSLKNRYVWSSQLQNHMMLLIRHL